MPACSYCKSPIAEGDTKCPNCGAPFDPDSSADQDFRDCPYCHRRLLALASPACNYCGRRLPEDFIKAREQDLHRVTEVSNPHHPESVPRAGGGSTVETPPSSPLVDVVDDLLDIFN